MRNFFVLLMILFPSIGFAYGPLSGDSGGIATGQANTFTAAQTFSSITVQNAVSVGTSDYGAALNVDKTFADADLMFRLEDANTTRFVINGIGSVGLGG